MHLTFLSLLFSTASLCLANPVDLMPRSTINGPCTGGGGAPGVCISTSSCTNTGGHYITGACPGTPNDIKCCTKPSCSSGGSCQWVSQCSSGKTVSGLCPGPADFKCCLPGGDDGSSTNGPISRSEIMSRAQFWIDRHVPYSQKATYPDPQGKRYRTDCSGFVSMALHSSAPGYSTVGLVDIARGISWDSLQPGDFVGTLGPGTGGDDGHVTLFNGWVDANTKKRYKTLECRGDKGCVASERPVGWSVGSHTAKPYRYTRVK